MVVEQVKRIKATLMIVVLRRKRERMDNDGII